MSAPATAPFNGPPHEFEVSLGSEVSDVGHEMYCYIYQKRSTFDGPDVSDNVWVYFRDKRYQRYMASTTGWRSYVVGRIHWGNNCWPSQRA